MGTFPQPSQADEPFSIIAAVQSGLIGTSCLFFPREIPWRRRRARRRESPGSAAVRSWAEGAGFGGAAGRGRGGPWRWRRLRVAAGPSSLPRRRSPSPPTATPDLVTPAHAVPAQSRSRRPDPRETFTLPRLPYDRAHSGRVEVDRAAAPAHLLQHRRSTRSTRSTRPIRSTRPTRSTAAYPATRFLPLRAGAGNCGPHVNTFRARGCANTRAGTMAKGHGRECAGRLLPASTLSRRASRRRRGVGVVGLRTSRARRKGLGGCNRGEPLPFTDIGGILMTAGLSLWFRASQE
jgi:hypothetical protein